MKKINAIRKSISMIPEHNEYLKDYSERSGMSESEFVRRLIEYFRHHEQDIILTSDRKEVDTNDTK